MIFEIKHRVSGAILFSLETDSIKLCVEAAIKSKASLYGADLRGADLGRADLRGSYLGGADLRGADLRVAHLRGAYLSWACLRGADLGGADLGGAYLGGAYLRGAYLSDADGEKLKVVGDRPYLAIGPIGSRSDYLQAWLTDAGIYVRAGCYWDTLAEFKKAVKTTHGTSKHAKEYAAAIAMIKAHAKLWMPA